MTARAAGALAATALLIPVLGCGDDENEGESFNADYQAETKQIEAIGGDIARALTSASKRSNTALARQFDALALRAQSSVDDLDELDPPEDLTDERDDLIEALETGTGDLRAIAAAARADEPAKARDAAKKLVDDSRAIRDARGKLNRLTLKD